MLRTNTAPDAHRHRFHGVLVIETRCGSCGDPMLVKHAVCYLPHCAFILRMPGQPWRVCRGH